MKKRSTVLLLGIFIVLIGVTYFLLRSPGERETSYPLTDFTLAVDSSQVQSIKFTRGSLIFSLQSIGGQWYVVKNEPIERRYPADETSVNQLLGNVQRLQILSLISSNPEKQNLFQVDSSGTFVSLTERTGKTTEFVVGKMGPSFSETYIRPTASNNVYLAEGITSWDVNKEVRDWRDKTVLKVEQDSIRMISYRYRKEQFSLVRDSVWRFQPTAREDVLNSTVTGLLSSISTLRAEDFVDSTFLVPTPHVKLELAAPQSLTLSFSPMPPDSSKYWVMNSSTQQIFVVNKWSVQSILKQRKDFLPPRK